MTSEKAMEILAKVKCKHKILELARDKALEDMRELQKIRASEKLGNQPEWISPLKKVPPVAKEYKYASEDVLCMLDDDTKIKAFYLHNTEEWYYAQNGKKLPNTVTVMQWKDK